MEEYKNLLKMLKVDYCNMGVLHRNLIGKEWFKIHELLSDYTDRLAKDIDELVEVGISIGVQEPGIKESLEYIDDEEVKPREVEDTLLLVKEMFDDIIAQINRIKDVSDDVINKLQEKQLYYRVESNYKIFRYL